jgi:hypothetical protein
VYAFNMLQIPNVAWQSYLQLSLHFKPWLLVSRYKTDCVCVCVCVREMKYMYACMWLYVGVYAHVICTPT